MRFASLGSGSQGNALIVDAGETKVLLDCGFSDAWRPPDWPDWRRRPMI
jgi:predicted metal-dependent RNase